MYKKCILFRNELKNKNIPTYKIVGIVSELLLSKEIFRANDDIRGFLDEIFSIKFKDYLYKSRTLLVSRTIRVILSIDNQMSYKSKLYLFIQKQIDFLSKESPKEKNHLDGWI